MKNILRKSLRILIIKIIKCEIIKYIYLPLGLKTISAKIEAFLLLYEKHGDYWRFFALIERTVLQKDLKF